MKSLTLFSFAGRSYKMKKAEFTGLEIEMIHEAITGTRYYLDRAVRMDEVPDRERTIAEINSCTSILEKLGIDDFFKPC
jgi:hypothetical protein